MSYLFDLNHIGATVVVDSVNGSDLDGQRGYFPFQTIQAAATAMQTGDEMRIHPGTYDLPATGLTLSTANTCLRGVDANTVTVRIAAAVADTDLITIAADSIRIEGVTLKLTSAEHHTLRGIVLNANMASAFKLRDASINVDNSLASSGGTSNVTGLIALGTDQADDDVDMIRASTVKVNSTGLGTKRAWLMNTNCTLRARDTNFAAYRVAGSGSFIALETNSASASMDIKGGCHANGFTADISQTSGTLSFDGALHSNNANGLGFSTTSSPAIIVWSDSGSPSASSTFFMRTGAAATANEQKFNIAQGCIAKSIGLVARTAPANSVTVTLRKNGVDTAVTVTLAGASTSAQSVANSVTIAAADQISMKIVTGSSTQLADYAVTVGFA